MGSAFDPVVVEPVVIPDTVVTGLHDIEMVWEGAYRFTFVASQRSISGECQEHVIALRVIMHKKAILHAALWTLREIGARCCGKGALLAMH